MKHTNFFHSFLSALHGIRLLFRESRNARIQLIILIGVCFVGSLLNIEKMEWLWILVSSTIVLCLEAMNTSIEHLADMHTTEYHPKIKILKDLAAGSVLLSSFGAIIIGLVIFVPYLRTLFSI